MIQPTETAMNSYPIPDEADAMLKVLEEKYYICKRNKYYHIHPVWYEWCGAFNRHRRDKQYEAQLLGNELEEVKLKALFSMWQLVNQVLTLNAALFTKRRRQRQLLKQYKEIKHLVWEGDLEEAKEMIRGLSNGGIN